MPGSVTDVRAGGLARALSSGSAARKVPVPIEAIAEDLCGLVVEEAADLDALGMLIPAERRVRLNATETGERRRFTLAHEVGHWACQCLEGTAAPRYCRASDVGLDPLAKVLEREANAFAAELLMPEDRVREQWLGAASAVELAEWFGVSAKAMTWWLYSFGLAGAPE
jgi:Zn-dependent peptidase ImmA (M78 family)